MTTAEPPVLSIVIPLGERHEPLGDICDSLKRVLAAMVKPYEVIFVDDGNGADTRQQLKEAAESRQEVRVIRLQRKMGEATALAVGAQAARGNIIVTLDAYLHVAVDELPKLLRPILNEGMDLVCAWRYPRRESGLGRLASDLFNAAASQLAGVTVHDLNCRMRAMRRKVLQELPMYGDLHRFLPIFAARRGFKWCEVQVPQQTGKQEVGAFAPASYLQRLLDLLTLAFLTRFVRRPLHFFGLIGACSFFAGLLIALRLVYVKWFVHIGIGHRPLLLLAVLLIVVGIQVASIGLLGELLVFTHARDLQDYVVEETVGGEPLRKQG